MAFDRNKFASIVSAKVATAEGWANYDNFNEGQKVLWKNYARVDSDVNLDAKLSSVPIPTSRRGFNVIHNFTVKTTRNRVKVEGHHEEAFNNLYNECGENGEYFASKAFNFSITRDDVFGDGGIVDGVVGTWKEALTETTRRIGVYR